jgi:hypothetical protein
MILDHIEKARNEQKARIFNTFKEATQEKQTATLISKADFEAQFPSTTHEIYSLKSVNAFRTEISKSDDVVNKDEAFQQATKDLKHFVVQNNGKSAIMFVRKKVSGE